MLESMKSQTMQRVTINRRALIARINRKLQQQPNPEILRAARNERQADEVGDYYTVDAGTFGTPRTALARGVVRVHVNLEKLSRELGVFQPWEQLDPEEK